MENNRTMYQRGYEEGRQEMIKRVVEEIKEFRHKHRNLNVSSEFDIAFDNFLSSLDTPLKAKDKDIWITYL